MSEAVAIAPRGRGRPIGSGVWVGEKRAEAMRVICERIKDGLSLKDIAITEAVPSEGEIYEWLDNDRNFADRYARARSEQAHRKFEQTWEIAQRATSDSVRVARLQIDTLKWHAGKLLPKVYGDNLQLRHADADGEKLDTAPLVAELMAAMAPGVKAQVIDVEPRVISTKQEAPTDRRLATDVSDLV